jgi:tetratricopeptide (TPR) repeat protein
MSHNAAELVKRGHAAMSSFQPELAAEFYSRALKAEENNAETMDALADALLQLGDPENAYPLILQSIALEPEGSPYKYLYLGQMQTDREALDSYQKAITLLTRDYALSMEENQKIAATAAQTKKDANDMDTDTDNEILKYDLIMIKKQLGKAYCSIADLFLTDLCEEDGAENNCEQALTKAIEIDATSLDVNQTLASLYFSQCKPDEACDIMTSVVARVTTALQASQNETIMQNNNVNTNVFNGAITNAVDECPEHHFCISTAKLAIECAATRPVMAEQAMELLAMLIEEDDENAELFYCMGMAALGAQPPDGETAKYHLDCGKDLLAKQARITGEDNSIQVNEIDKLLLEVSTLEANQEIADEAIDDEEAEEDDL